MGEFAHLVVRGFRVLERLVDQRGRILEPLELAACELERHDRVHEARLRPVVQITHRPAALLVGGGHDPSSGGGEVGPRLDVGDRRRHQLGEVGDPRLGVVGHRLRPRRSGRDRTPSAR